MGISFERQAGRTERRRHGRAPLNLLAAFRERSRSAIDVQVTDFTGLGCRIEGAVPVDRSAQMFIKLPGLESQPARLVWIEGMTAGFEFEAQLHPAVAARFMPAQGSHAALTILSATHGHDPLLSRREQILAGIAGSSLSPLQRKKKPTGLGMFGRIDRRVSRATDTRAERRYSDAVPEGTGLAVEGSEARVLNVSPSGMKISAQLTEKNIGDAIVLEFEGFPEMTGQLVWMSGGEAGISLPEQAIELFDSSAY